jgi:exodeoxyribonuclease VII small subunit
MSTPNPLGYDQAMQELEAILVKMESGGCGLEELNAEAARAMTLIRHCRERLRSVEAELDKLLEEE